MTVSFLLLVLFILMQGFFAGMETGMVSIRRPRVTHSAENGSRSAKIILFFMNKPGLMISTTLLGVNISVVGASLSAKSFTESLGLSTAGALLGATTALSLIMLTCEIIPKNWFRQSPFSRCSRFIWLLYATYFLLYVPARIFDAFTSLLSRLLSSKGGASVGNAVMREDLRLFFRESESDGGLPHDGALILDNAVGIHSATVADVMIPMESVFSVPDHITVAEAVSFCREKNITRVPAMNSAGKASGVFSIYDAMFYLPEEVWNSTRISGHLAEAPVFHLKTGLGEVLAKIRDTGLSMFIAENDAAEPVGVFTTSNVARKLFAENL